ncbi:PVC-type heme-binding CxxCH protein [Planctomicrobium piriforme]|uniref:Putative membrane-bound dehydrogenase domain-containing protein n=1 Tax=Planctomicrobium piriforme TaxID=1576369 RepID=A0A1I3J0A7_9PLAN|nr:PVC-type heme-binding CxxCH protein [Planctomicrobium piriforme]SFI53515.1 putative membrane-bound dehydrogenase domain-containing protein [Planctomicrobium piriforme]
MNDQHIACHWTRPPAQAGAVISIAMAFACAFGVLAVAQAQTMTPSTAPQSGPAGNAEVEKVMQTFQGRGDIGDDSEPTPAPQAIQQFQLDEGLKIELLASEPDVKQPLYLWFDERERMWLVEYRQYPFPAGLKVLRYDQHLRAVFDNVPKPPPHHVPGLDKVSVFEDTDGDGQYDQHRDVITGLNIATAVVTGRGGIWILNPPYLLFYPDANGDDVPDGDPQVKLSGFGLQDTHAVANSLAWGPDGWLYGANGSTTTADVTSKASHVRFEGQCIWRFQPETEVFEMFAEGGGNTFSLEFDAEGRLFSGTNFDDTRGMFYPQGSYGVKNFGKHGPLSSPYAFGFFKHMEHQGDKDRFAQTFILYEGDTLPERYRGRIIAANALHNRVWASDLIPQGSTYRTVDLPVVCTTKDRWFRPVDVKAGPDGGIYLADWYDTRLSHVDPRDNWHKGSGRLYRLQAKDAPAHHPVDMNKQTDEQLIALLSHPNKWQRQTAVRVLGERLSKEAAASKTKTIEQLTTLCQSNSPGALEALWVLHWSGSFDEALARKLLSHENPHVRRWTVRLLGDRRLVSTSLGSDLASLAEREPDVQVRSQLASTARRLEAALALPILDGLLRHPEDAGDPHLPLLIWWGLEAQCGSTVLNGAPHVGVPLTALNSEPPREQLLQWLTDNAKWGNPIVKQTLATRLMQRFALENAGRPAAEQDWTSCDRLLALAPTPELRDVLLSGFLEAYQGQPGTNLPDALKTAVQDYQAQLGKSDVVTGMRLGQPDAIKKGLALLKDNSADPSLRLTLAQACGQTTVPGAVPVLVGLLRSPSSALKKEALLSLVRYSDEQIPTSICAAYHSTLTAADGQRVTALRVLASRPEWTQRLLKEVAEYRIPVGDVPADVVQQMRLHTQPDIQKQMNGFWGQVRQTNAEKQQQIERLHQLVRGRQKPDGGKLPDAQAGQKLFREHCGTCHTLFGEGGSLGPNLTGYERSNLDFLLLAIVDPSAGIREEFTQFQVVTTDGRVLTGLLTDQSPLAVTLKGTNNQTTVIPREQIDILQAMSTSLMPEGALQKLSDEQVLALFQYLMSPVPVR